jgi:hypothetical protein
MQFAVGSFRQLERLVRLRFVDFFLINIFLIQHNKVRKDKYPLSLISVPVILAK